MRAAFLIVSIVLFVLQLGCSTFTVAPPDATADNLTITAATGPLAPQAYRAQLRFAYEPPTKLHAGQTLSLHLLVKNLSDQIWPSGSEPDGKYQIRIGNRWRNAEGAVTEDGRGSLSYDLRPGDEAEVLIVITAPKMPGEYALEFDMVQEQVAWFSDKGSEKLRVNMRVE